MIKCVMCDIIGYERLFVFSVFFFNDTATTEIYTLSLHDALPICVGRREGAAGTALRRRGEGDEGAGHAIVAGVGDNGVRSEEHRLNSSHSQISYAVFCLKKKYHKPIASDSLAAGAISIH